MRPQTTLRRPETGRTRRRATLFRKNVAISPEGGGRIRATQSTAPIGIFPVRIANFIKPELWGRPTDVPWAMIFPGVDDQPRHPSQLYEAGLEGLLLFLVLALFVRAGALKRPGVATGIFCIGYGMARIVSEFFREPDPQQEKLAHGLTMGMVLSAPLVLIGAALLVYVLRFRRERLDAGMAKSL